MLSTNLANWKENLNKIALDVHDDDDDDEELSIYNRRDSSLSDRRVSNKFPRSPYVSSSPVANGFETPSNSETEQYKAEIKRLQESEAQVKALSVNYAALLKEKEDQISRMNQENGTLKLNLDATNAALVASRSESLSNKGSNKAVSRTRSIGSPTKNGLSNGVAHSNVQGNGKDLADSLEEKNRAMVSLRASNELQIKQSRVELENEREKLANLQLRLQEEQKSTESFKEELKSLKNDKDIAAEDTKKVQDELNKKISEIRRLESELTRRNNVEADDQVQNLKRAIAKLEKENSKLKMERDELKASFSNKLPDSASEDLHPLVSFPGKEEMESSLKKLEKDLKEALRERDKASHELKRLKQHLLDKESEESEKMDEDSKIIEELRQNNEYQRAQILRLEKALKQAIAGQDEVRLTNNTELQKSKELIDDLNKRLRSYTNTIDAKNVELLNLQTALGQYYAEIEAKEHLEGDLASAREESAKLSHLLKDAHEKEEISKKEKEDILGKLSDAENMILDSKKRVNKLEEDNGKLRRALEQSMTRLNRMSMDSDYFVDRRIVIKLLVTYFQRNHSKEVLDLMVRMLGFSEEDRQKIGVAQQGASGKGVVRGVLGFPGRLVGGILGGTSTLASSASENQSFADLWVDFLLKETEEREKRGESGEAINGSNGLRPEISDSEFSTVPLTSSESSSKNSRLLPGY